MVKPLIEKILNDKIELESLERIKSYCNLTGESLSVRLLIEKFKQYYRIGNLLKPIPGDKWLFNVKNFTDYNNTLLSILKRKLFRLNSSIYISAFLIGTSRNNGLDNIIKIINLNIAEYNTISNNLYYIESLGKFYTFTKIGNRICLINEYKEFDKQLMQLEYDIIIKVSNSSLLPNYTPRRSNDEQSNYILNSIKGIKWIKMTNLKTCLMHFYNQ